MSPDTYIQYSFNTTVTVVAVDTQGCKNGAITRGIVMKCLTNEGVWDWVEGAETFPTLGWSSNDYDAVVRVNLTYPLSCRGFRVYPNAITNSKGLRSEVIIIDY